MTMWYIRLAAAHLVGEKATVYVPTPDLNLQFQYGLTVSSTIHLLRKKQFACPQ